MKRFHGRNLAELTDKQLESLHGDAIRLCQSGTADQRRQAETMLPSIGAEIMRRREKPADRAKRDTGRKANMATQRSVRQGKPKPGSSLAH